MTATNEKKIDGLQKKDFIFSLNSFIHSSKLKLFVFRLHVIELIKKQLSKRSRRNMKW